MNSVVDAVVHGEDDWDAWNAVLNDDDEMEGMTFEQC